MESSYIISKEALYAREERDHNKKAASTKKRAARGDQYTCEVCGLEVTVDEIEDYTEYTESAILCCGKEMKPKKKAAAKKA